MLFILREKKFSLVPTSFLCFIVFWLPQTPGKYKQLLVQAGAVEEPGKVRGSGHLRFTPAYKSNYNEHRLWITMYHGCPCNEFTAAPPEDPLLWEYLQHRKVDQRRSIGLIYERICIKENWMVYYISCTRFPISRMGCCIQLPGLSSALVTQGSPAWGQSGFSRSQSSPSFTLSCFYFNSPLFLLSVQSPGHFELWNQTECIR